ncbi:hypothetical protein Bache_2858 [Bacteroides helcogenes P 36-108]|uniref:Uncharacterized protein n=1 Tax=Bacteroides helcogenes (strain ATCC 35417 / DSM 20613 / JCM 6297 / CCUG 15421 / P 36-108) TaxID=693979 RepID=E6SNR1_BACT6|nr:hypothetical protein Bache_2858 [Bacteroides helcogenes P 36-108]
MAVSKENLQKKTLIPNNLSKNIVIFVIMNF